MKLIVEWIMFIIYNGVIFGVIVTMHIIICRLNEEINTS